jgi:UDP-N-acetylglucosamine 2-epimerase (non-hydrolysing)
MKAAPILAAIDERNSIVTTGVNPASGHVERVLLHTGQHYDGAMSEAFFRDLELPRPDVNLHVGSGTHAGQTAEIMQKFEPVLLHERPDALLVVGDVTSTLACALVAAKTTTGGYPRPLIGHVEAGLRSFDRSMPEEINRVLADHLADLLFVTEESGLRNLDREGIPRERVHFVGNTMIDSLMAFKEKAATSPILQALGLRSPADVPAPGDSALRDYAVLTLHRPGNVDDRAALVEILAGLREITSQWPVVFPVHPRTRQRLAEFGMARRFQAADTPETPSRRAHHGLVLAEPLGYLDFVCLMMHARLVITDSGGIQEETTCLGVPCVTVRENTERPVTVERGTNIVSGTRADGIRAAIRRQRESQHRSCAPPKWDGRAARRIIDVIIAATHERIHDAGSNRTNAVRERGTRYGLDAPHPLRRC